MGNNYFQFKQFTVRQENCAMKVTTDGCLFGAVLAQMPQMASARRILDIGAGTGLLSLMVAQKTPMAIVNAVEINDFAVGDCRENFEASPWSGRLHVSCADILTVAGSGDYDAIITNPPFFENSLKSPDAARNSALHELGFSIKHLPQIFDRHLSATGVGYVLLPFVREAQFVELMHAAGWVLHFSCRVRQTENHQPFRSMLGFGRKAAALVNPDDVVIKAAGAYSGVFIGLLKDYYLYL
jgi:tRNA1Val (adenine37-N6)-methyltransferase